MSSYAELHLCEIKKSFTALVDKKYRKGQAEHGGDLHQRNLSTDILEEAIDQVVYALTQKDQHFEISVHLKTIRGLVSGCDPYIRKRVNQHIERILTFIS